MNFEDFDPEHIDLAMEFLNKQCKGNALRIGVNLSHQLEIKSKTYLDEHVTIIIYSKTSSYLPTIMKEDRLHYVLERLKNGSK